MSDNLRSKILRLAHANPSLRPHLLPLIKKAMSGISPSVEEAIETAALHQASLPQTLVGKILASDKLINTIPVEVPDFLKSLYQSLGIEVIRTQNGATLSWVFKTQDGLTHESVFLKVRPHPQLAGSFLYEM